MRRILTALLLALTLTACGGTSSNGPAGWPSRTPVTPAASGLVVASGHGWHGNTLDGPTFPARACHMRGTTAQPQPDPRCTPGATDAAVTQADLTATICAVGYTTTVRPPASVTGPAKRESEREYGWTGTGEYDHLVSLELGGASDTRNLWPEPGPIPNAKDTVENKLRALVCMKVGIPGRYGQPPCPTCPAVALATAQRLIAADWTTALAKATQAAR